MASGLPAYLLLLVVTDHPPDVDAAHSVAGSVTEVQGPSKPVEVLERT